MKLLDGHPDGISFKNSSSCMATILKIEVNYRTKKYPVSIISDIAIGFGNETINYIYTGY